MYRIGFTSMISLDHYCWWIEFTPGFYGAGMLSGMNASWSFFMGAVLAWGIIAPSVIATGEAVGLDLGMDNRWSYLSLHLKDIEEYSKTPSPRYWLLWPGVIMMIVYTLFEVGISSRHVYYRMLQSLRSGFRDTNQDPANPNDPGSIEKVEDDNDPAPPEDRVPLWAWAGGLIISIILTCSIAPTQWDMGVGESILALIFGFLLSFLAVRSAGDTDLNPASICAKASQLMFGGIAKSQKRSIISGQTLNLPAGFVSSGPASQSADMIGKQYFVYIYSGDAFSSSGGRIGDLKTGHLIGAKPKNQFAAQLAGATASIFLNVGLFILFTKSAPCILYTPDDGVCTYGAPSVSAWAAIAAAVLAKTLRMYPFSLQS